MPVYQYRCTCGHSDERILGVYDRDNQVCPGCMRTMERQLSAPLFRFAGRVAPGGGPDKFTADMLGIPLHDLPSGLRTDPATSDGK